MNSFRNEQVTAAYTANDAMASECRRATPNPNLSQTPKAKSPAQSQKPKAIASDTPSTEHEVKPNGIDGA